MVSSLTPQDLYRTGQAAYRRKEFLEAAEAFKASAAGYELLNDPLTAAEMRNNSSVAFLQADSPQAAYEMAYGTPEIFATSGDPAREGMAWGNIGSALEGLKRIEEALEAYTTSADLLQQAGESEARLRVIQALSALQLQSGKRIQALSTMQAGLEDIEKPTLKQKALKKLLHMPFDLLNRSG